MIRHKLKDLALSRRWRNPTEYRCVELEIGDMTESVNERLGLIVGMFQIRNRYDVHCIQNKPATYIPGCASVKLQTLSDG
jgi:hypothetical protein